jgi:hypothetical protein
MVAKASKMFLTVTDVFAKSLCQYTGALNEPLPENVTVMGMFYLLSSLVVPRTLWLILSNIIQLVKYGLKILRSQIGSYIFSRFSASMSYGHFCDFSIN